MADVRPDPRPVSEDGIGRKKPPRHERRGGRIMASPKQWQAIIASKGSACRLNDEWTFAADPRSAPIEYHHLVPRSQGGDDVPDNIVPLCRICHEAVTHRKRMQLEMLARSLTDAEYAYVTSKLGEGGMERLFGVGR